MPGIKKPKDKKIRQRPILISDEVYFAIKRHAKAAGLGVSEIMRKAVMEYLVSEKILSPEK
jgi:hypothetical protein